MKLLRQVLGKLLRPCLQVMDRGTGLGLFLASELAQTNGATLWHVGVAFELVNVTLSRMNLETRTAPDLGTGHRLLLGIE